MSLPTILLILAALSFGATVITILIAFRSDREARSAIFPIVREEEAVRAQRARISVFVWAAVTALFLGGWLASLRLGVGTIAPLTAESTPVDQSGGNEAVLVAETATAAVTKEIEPLVNAAEDQPASTDAAAPEAVIPSPTIGQTPANTPIPLTATADTPPSPTATALPPTVTPTNTPPPPTARPTDTATPEPTATPQPTDTPTPAAFVAVTMPASAPRTPAPPGAKMGPIQFATEISAKNEAINPDDLFPQGVETIYAVFPYEGMQDGIDFKVIWYQNGRELWRDENEWRWGKAARFYSFINSPSEGLYKLELHVNDSILATGLFEIR